MYRWLLSVSPLEALGVFVLEAEGNHKMTSEDSLPVSDPIEDPDEMEKALRHYINQWRIDYAAKFPEQHKKLRDWRIDFRIEHYEAEPLPQKEKV